MSKVDMELKKAFIELQEKQANTETDLNLADFQIEELMKTKQHAIISARELSTLDDDVRTYESVARVFLLTPIQKVRENLNAKQNSADEKIKALEKNKEYLQKSLKEAADSLRELVQTKKDS